MRNLGEFDSIHMARHDSRARRTRMNNEFIVGLCAIAVFLALIVWGL